MARSEYQKYRERILARLAGQRRAAGAKAQHGLTVDPLLKATYRTWQFVKDRCHNERSIHYPRYGGRGIRLAAIWLNEPVAFVAYMGPKPSPRHSIDRFPDQNGDYEPGNVRWATYEEQNQNRRVTKLDAWDVRFIRHWLATYTQTTIATAFGVTSGAISRINTGSCWTNVMGGV